jgi:hypothetical protein
MKFGITKKQRNVGNILASKSKDGPTAILQYRSRIGRNYRQGTLVSKSILGRKKFAANRRLRNNVVASLTSIKEALKYVKKTIVSWHFQ